MLVISHVQFIYVTVTREHVQALEGLATGVPCECHSGELTERTAYCAQPASELGQGASTTRDRVTHDHYVQRNAVYLLLVDT